MHTLSVRRLGARALDQTDQSEQGYESAVNEQEQVRSERAVDVH